MKKQLAILKKLLVAASIYAIYNNRILSSLEGTTMICVANKFEPVADIDNIILAEGELLAGVISALRDARNKTS